MRTIEITVNPDGSTTVQTKGFTGAGCKEASRFLEEALGEVEHERRTAEYCQVSQDRQVRNQQGG